MTEEALSALIDGECGPAEVDRLLRELDRDPALRRRYSLLCRGRDGRSGVRLRRGQPDLADRVAGALDGGAEPRLLRFPARNRRGWQTSLALAAAAGVAAVAVLVLRPESPGSLPAAPEATVAVSVPVPVAPEAGRTADREWGSLDAGASQQLSQYLITYSRSRAQQGVGGTLGHARYAAYTGQARTDESGR